MPGDDDVLSRLAAFDEFDDEPMSARPAFDHDATRFGAPPIDPPPGADQFGTHDVVGTHGVVGAHGPVGVHGPAGTQDRRHPSAGMRRMPQARRDGPSFGSVVREALLPGAGLVRTRPIIGTLLLVAGVWAPIVAAAGVFMVRDQSARWLLNPEALRAIIIVAATAVAARVVAVAMHVRGVPVHHQRRTAAIGFAVVGALAIPAAVVSVRFEQLNRVVDDVFAGDGGAGPVAAAADDVDAQHFQTVLLLGGDEGPGRFGLRTDTMILLIVHHESGRVAMVSVPRNLEGVRFPPGSAMHDRYPDGFDDLANAIFPTVYADEELSAAYAVGGLDPGARALMEGLSYSLGITIDDYALINMVGFIDVVDAIGGVTLTLDSKIPMPGNPPGAKHQVPPSIGPGEVEMDGTVALGYVRSRAADSDYQRMERQRRLLTAVAAGFGASDVITRFGELSDALRGTIRTSLSEEEALGLLGTIENAGEDIDSAGLVPPLLEPSDPEWDDAAEVLELVRESLFENTDLDTLLIPLIPPTTPDP